MLSRVTVLGTRPIEREFKVLAATADTKILAAVAKHGQLLQTRVMANASGRPGPNVVTGDYRRSIALRVFRNGGMAVAVVGTNKPQGRRLEFGFHGVDSLGRAYNQPPYPHFGPAVDATEGPFIRELEALIT